MRSSGTSIVIQSLAAFTLRFSSPQAFRLRVRFHTMTPR
jgi:hypothetical protein